MKILSSIYAPFIEKSFLSPLSKPQRKVSMLALGIIFGSLAFAASCCAVFFICFRRRAREIKEKNEEQPKSASSSGQMHGQSSKATTAALSITRPPEQPPLQPIVPLPLSPPISPRVSPQPSPQPVVGAVSTDLAPRNGTNGGEVNGETNGHQDKDDSKVSAAVSIVNGSANHGTRDVDEKKETVFEELDPVLSMTETQRLDFAETEKLYVNTLVGFVFEWFRKIASRPTSNNDIVSPLGISQLLSIIRAGASIESREVIDSLSHLPKDAYNILLKVSELIKTLTKDGLRILNLIYLDNKYEFSASYAAHVAGYRAQAVRGVSNEKDHSFRELNSREINSYVARATNGIIPGSVSKGDISQTGFTFLLLNAMHLSARWLDPFEVANTKLENFTTSSGVKKVEMMHKVGSFDYFQDRDCQAVLLPYGGDKSNFSLLVVLPTTVDLQFMNAQKFALILNRARKTNVSFAMPKFAFKHKVNVIPEFKKAARGEIVLDFSLMRAENPTAAKKSLRSSFKMKETWAPTQIFQELSFSCDENGSDVHPSENVDGKINGLRDENKEASAGEIEGSGSRKFETMHCNRTFLAIVVNKTRNPSGLLTPERELPVLPIMLTIVKDPIQPNKIGSEPIE